MAAFATLKLRGCIVQFVLMIIDIVYGQGVSMRNKLFLWRYSPSGCENGQSSSVFFVNAARGMTREQLKLCVIQAEAVVASNR
jgi:hypothetical protein